MKYYLLFVFLSMNLYLSALSPDDISKNTPLSVTVSSAQLADYLKPKLTNEEQYVRAVYVWIAMNVRYDFENRYKYGAPTSIDSLVNFTIKNKKGVCQGFSELFADVLNRLGVKTYCIPGYTRQNGEISDIGHQWNAVHFKNGKWALYDPTWASGYVSDNRFIRNFSEDYYAVKPEEFIKTHMPFDPIWQLLKFPVQHQDFYLENFAPSMKNPFFFNDSISVYEKQNDLVQALAVYRRVESSGVINDATVSFLHVLGYNIDVMRYNVKVNAHNEMADKFNLATAQINLAIDLFNIYVAYKNKGYRPEKRPKDIMEMLNKADRSTDSALQVLSTIKPTTSVYAKDIKDIKATALQVKKKINEEKNFLKKKFRF